MKLNLYNFAAMQSTNNAESTMFAMIVATKLTKSYPIIEKSIEYKNPKTESALIGFALDCYDDFMANIHPEIDKADSGYMAIFTEYLLKVHSQFKWETEKSSISIFNSSLTMRRKKAQSESAK